MIETGKIINGDCVEVMKTLPEGCIDMVVMLPTNQLTLQEMFSLPQYNHH